MDARSRLDLKHHGESGASLHFIYYATFEALFRRVVACRRVVQDELPNVVAPDVLLAVLCARWRVPHSPFTPPDLLACRTIADPRLDGRSVSHVRQSLVGTYIAQSNDPRRPQSCLRRQPKARCDARDSYSAFEA
ncbi:hypothetical protein PSPO01_07314 [Paraphaeosphaeria sporulosa]